MSTYLLHVNAAATRIYRPCALDFSFKMDETCHDMLLEPHLVDIVRGMLLNVPHPIPDIVEGGLVRDIIYQQDAHGSSVIGCTSGLLLSVTGHKAVARSETMRGAR